MVKRRALIFFALIAAGLTAFSSQADSRPPSHYTDLDDAKVNSKTATLEFSFQLLKDISADPHNHVLLLGVSSDGADNYSIEIVQDELIARRMFGRCLLTAFSSPYHFKIGEWHQLKLTWNQVSTKFFVDNEEVKKIGLLSSDDIPKMVPGIRLGLESNFKIDHFHASDKSDISVDPEDQDAAAAAACPNINELLNEKPQENYRTVSFHHFPDQQSRDIIKSYLALLPDHFAKSIKHIVYVEHERFSKRGEAGVADSQSMSIILDGLYFSDPNVFFHEAAHLYDYKLGINFGVPDEKNEWAAISGASCYFKGSKLEEFAKEFEKTKVKNAILSPQGGQCDFEDFAIWVGAVYDYYLKNKTMTELLNPSSAKYNKKNKTKLDFLLKKGFVSRQIYSKVVRSEPLQNYQDAKILKKTDKK